MSNALAIISGTIEKARGGFLAAASVNASNNVNFEAEAGFAVQVLLGNAFAMGVATSNPQSVIDAVTYIAAIGISLNPAKKQAYLVPRNNKICLDISYIGLLDLAVASGSILFGQSELVRELDQFALNGIDKPPTHSYNPFATDRGDIIGAYVVVKMHTGDFLTTTMTIGECNDIRDRSEAWKRGKSGPWKTDPGEMIKKTVIKRASKLWPKTDRLDHAIHHLNTDGAEGIDMHNAPVKPENWVDVQPMILAALQTKTDAEALAYWKANHALVAKQADDHTRLKNVIAAHRVDLRSRDEQRTVDVDMPEAAPALAPQAQQEPVEPPKAKKAQPPVQPVTDAAMAAFDDSFVPE